MKKQMFIAGALLCGAALAAGPLQATALTSGVVGYNNNAVSQFMFIGTPFQQLGGADNATLIDLKVNCSETEDSPTGWQPNADAVVQLDASGSFVRKLVYIPTWLAAEAGCTKGWYDENDVIAEDFSTRYDSLVSWNAGEGFQVCVSGEDATVQIDPAITE